MKRRIFALWLALCLPLAGCGIREKEDQEGVLERASGLAGDSVLLTVDGREVEAWQYLYWLAFTCDQLQERYDSVGLDLEWAAPVEGGTLADYVKDQALADAALYAVVENWAEKYGVAVSEEDQTALAEAWAEKAEAKGGEEAYLALLKNQGLNRTRAEKLSQVGQLYGKLYELCGAADGPLTPDPEALADFAADQGRLTVDRLLVPIGGDREAAQATAASLFARLNESSDKAEAFPSLAAEGVEHFGPRTLLPGEGVMDPVLEEAAAALTPGQCSGILESEEGFSILLRRETDPESALGDYFDHLLEEAAKNAAVETTEAYQALDAAAFAGALAEAREAVQREGE
ncbi:MAG: hypothetical protein HDT19_00240 [Oscillibacter sp.]|nr:hypothetical protein [Oscillibacter sp.]